MRTCQDSKNKVETVTILFYGAIGAFSVGVDVAVFTGLRFFGISPTIAQAVSYLSGTFVSFSLNAVFNFRVTTALTRRLILFLSIALINSMLSSWVLELLIAAAFLHELVLKVLVTAPFLVLQYVLNRHVTFRP